MRGVYKPRCAVPSCWAAGTGPPSHSASRPTNMKPGATASGCTDREYLYLSPPAAYSAVVSSWMQPFGTRGMIRLMEPRIITSLVSGSRS